MSDLSSPFLLDFKSELLRWNKQISLVSRQGTRGIVDNLLYQSNAGFDVFWKYVNSFVDNHPADTMGAPVGNPVGNSFGDVFDGVIYFDLGSGGGLPGVVWSHRLFSKDFKCRSFLVEPREKRSWFLNRISNRLASFDCLENTSMHVIASRWGEAFDENLQDMKCPLVLISLKALHLDDKDVLDGLRAFFEKGPLCGHVVIARYYPGSQIIDDKLRESLGFHLNGSSGVYNGSGVFVGCDSLSIPPAGFLPSSLVVSHYKF